MPTIDLTEEELLAHIDIVDGEPRIAGTRIPVWIVLGALADGLTHEMVIDDYPALTQEDIFACLLYAAKLTMPKDTEDASTH